MQIPEFTVDPKSILTAEAKASAPNAHVVTMFDEDPSTAFMGITITDIGEGTSAGHFTVRPEMCNGHGTAQGGFLYTFADSLFAACCNSFGDVAVAAHNSMHYLAPSFSGDVIEGRGEVKQRWGRNGIADIVLTKNDVPIAEFRGTFRVLPNKPQQR